MPQQQSLSISHLIIPSLPESLQLLLSIKKQTMKAVYSQMEDCQVLPLNPEGTEHFSPQAMCVTMSILDIELQLLILL